MKIIRFITTSLLWKFVASLYFTRRFFAVLSGLVVVFAFAFFYDFLLEVARVCFLAVILLLLLDMVFLYSRRKGLEARRIVPEKMSNGDQNPIMISIRSRYPYPIQSRVIDELPAQFQIRDFSYSKLITPNGESLLEYKLRPVKRGEYVFGNINIYAATLIFFVRRRYKFARDQVVPVYPSFIQMRKYELLAISNRLTEGGIKKLRKVGISTEFEQIRDYVPGDDYRGVNWKATARRGNLMVNHYQDEKSQQVYCVIDKGRVMKMPFNGLSLLDYSINASLVISNIALLKQDKAGIITFSERMGAFLPAERRSYQMRKILEVLFSQKTRYLESNHEMLYAYIKMKVTRRSLLLFYTNFETLSSLKRQLPFFRMLAKSHLLVLIFFENTELKTLLQTEVKTTEDIYIKTIAEKLAYEKRLIVKELERNGIFSILTPPEQLTVNTINKYLELKARGMI